MKTQEFSYFTALAGASVVLGIVFAGSGRLICYSLMGAGILFSIIGGIKMRKQTGRKSLVRRIVL
jgi:hypothetical protein